MAYQQKYDNSPEKTDLIEASTPLKENASNSIGFHAVISAIDDMLKQSEFDQYRSNVSRETFRTCSFCTFQSNCGLLNVANLFSARLIDCTEQTKIENINEHLKIFCAGLCPSFTKIPDPLIP